MNEKLIAAVYEQNGSWQSIKDVASCYSGAAGGFSGFIYYTETTEFYDKNWELIRDVIKEQSLDLGGVSEMISNFKNGQELIDVLLEYGWRGIAETGSDEWEVTQFKNTMAWYALEEVAQWVQGWDDYPEDIPEDFVASYQDETEEE